MPPSPADLKDRFFRRPEDMDAFLHAWLEHLHSGPPQPRLNDKLSFAAFAAARAERAKAQLFQDLWVLWETGEKRGGYFVEIGGGDGVHWSNTYLLEKDYGWTGIIAEPNPDFVDKVRKARSCHVSDACVYARSGEVLQFLRAEMGEISRIATIAPDDELERNGARMRGNRGEVEVTTISLDDLLEQAGAPDRIDFLSVDTEGAEYEILSNFDFSRREIGLICVEHNYTPMRRQLHDLLTGVGFRRKWAEYTQFDDWYVRS